MRKVGPLTGPMLQEFDQAQAIQTQYTPLATQLGGEFNSRQSAIDQARQQRDRVASDLQITKRALAALARARNGDGKLGDDLTTVLQGDSLPAARAATLQRAGLIAPLQDDGGQAGFRATSTGFGLLPRDAQQIMAADPLKFRIDDETIGTLSAKQTAPAGPRMPDAPPPAQDSASATTRAASTPLGGVAPSNATDQDASSQPKPYLVGSDGAVRFDASQPVASLLAAYKDGAVGDADMQTLLPKAQAADAAQKEQDRIAKENPAAWKAFAGGAASNAAFLAGMAPGSALGTEIGTGIGALGGGHDAPRSSARVGGARERGGAGARQARPVQAQAGACRNRKQTDRRGPCPARV